jgi:RNA polymerase sigma-70 factor (ECF subfamily)
MVASMTGDSSETSRLLQRAAAGDQEGWGALLARHRDRLRRMVAIRLDQRLQGRIDPSDVLQEVYLEAQQHLAEYLQKPSMPIFLWLRAITGNKLLELHRYHLGTQMRNASQEVSLYRGSLPETSSAALAAHLLGHDTRPSEAAVRAEIKIRLQEALNSMDPPGAMLSRPLKAFSTFSDKQGPRKHACRRKVSRRNISEKAARVTTFPAMPTSFPFATFSGCVLCGKDVLLMMDPLKGYLG